MQEILEVDYKRVIDWLLERHKLPDDWNRKLKALKLKQEELISKLSKEIKDKQINEYVQCRMENFTYLDYLKVQEMLQQSDEAKSKTMFGGFTSQYIKEWLRLSQLYKNNNLHLVDLVKFTIQTVQYDIPGIKKNLVSLDQQINSVHQKITEYTVSIKENQNQFERQCQKYNIPGKNIEEEVPTMVQQLPQLFSEISQQLIKQQDIQDCLNYYLKFSNYSNTQSHTEEFMQTLQTFINIGDVPIQPVDQIQQNPIQEVEIQQHEQPIEIDWTKFIEPQEEIVEIKFIETTLSVQQTRNDLISNLNEVNRFDYQHQKLLFFVKIRISSTQNYTQNALLQVYDHDEQEGLFDITLERLKQWHQKVENILNLLNSHQFRLLLTLVKNKKSQQRIKDHLSTFKMMQEKSQKNIYNSKSKINDLETEMKNNQSQLNEIVIRTQESKNKIEALLKETIKWQVNLTGEITKVKLI